MRPYSKTSQVWWHMPVIPVTEEAEVGGSRFEIGPMKNHELLSEKQLKAKGTGVVAQVVEHCLANGIP
jgi:hypothetical protein